MIVRERRAATDGAPLPLVSSDAASVEDVGVRDHAPHEPASPVGLRVLFAVDSRFPAVGGAESQALKLATALTDRGAQVRFVTPRVDPEQPLHERFGDFDIERVDYPHVRWFGSLALMVNFARYLMRQRAQHDVLHVHITHLMAATAGLMRRWTGLRVITKISGFYEFEHGVLDQRRRFMPLNQLLRVGLRRVDKVQTISEQTRGKLLDAGIDDRRILFVPNGIDTRVSLEPPAPADPASLRIGYCGRLRRVKGVHVLLVAFAALLEALPDRHCRLIVAGDGTDGAALREEAQSLGIDAHVEWLGMIDDTLPFLASLDIYVQPSFAEGLPNSVMEAMVCSRAIVATDIGGNRDLVEDRVNGLLVPAGDASALEHALLELAADEGLRERYGRQGRATIERDYAIDAVIDRLVESYRG